MTRCSFLLVAVIAGTAALPASAQVLGLPVVNNGVPTGIAFNADVGFSNEDAGKGTAVGGSAALGLGIIGLTASVSRFSPEGSGEATMSAGASASVNIFGGPLIPFRVVLQAGFAAWDTGASDDVTALGDASRSSQVLARSRTAIGTTTHIPLSVGLAATIPGVAFALKPWIAPRIDVLRRDGEASTNFGISGGIELSMLNGLMVRASYDRLFVDGSSPAVISIGAGFAP